MIDLVSLNIKNFLSIEEIYLEFQKPGNYIIVGYNELGGDSNGSGKSAILNAIIWTLFGRTTKGLRGSDIVRWGSGGATEVNLFLRDTTKREYQISRTPNSVVFKINGAEVAGHKKDIQQTINETFHTNYDLALSSIMFTKGQADFLTDSGDASKKRLFKSILRLEKIDKMYEQAKVLYGRMTEMAQMTEYDISFKDNQIKSLNTELESLKDKSLSWKEDHLAYIKRLEDDLYKQTPTIDEALETKLARQMAQIQVLEDQISLEEERTPFITAELSECYKNVGYYRTLIETLEKEFLESESLQGANCSYCGSPLTKRGLYAHLEEKNQKILDAKNSLSMHTLDMQNREAEITRIGNLKRDLVTITKDYQNTYSLVATQRTQIEAFKASKEQVGRNIEEEKKRENPFVIMYKDKALELHTTETDLAKAKEKFNIDLKTIDVLSYVKWVLSREGVVSVIIEKTFGRLQALINRYLSAVCTEGFFVELKPQKELKSGAMKDEIDISITQKGRKVPYSALSGGQEQRITIASLLALYKLSKELGMNSFNFLLLDEVLDLSLAEKGQQDIIRLLEGMDMEIRNILVISHKDSLVTEFPFQISVRRGMDEITRLEGIYQS